VVEILGVGCTAHQHRFPLYYVRWLSTQCAALAEPSTNVRAALPLLRFSAVLEIPLVHFSVKFWNTLHQSASVADPNAKVQMDGYMLFTLFWGLITFSTMFAWLVLHRQRVLALEDIEGSHGLDRAITERRNEAGVN